MDDIDDLLASLRAVKGDKRESAKAKKAAGGVQPSTGKAAGRKAGGKDEATRGRSGSRSKVPANQGTERARVRDEKGSPAPTQPASPVVGERKLSSSEKKALKEKAKSDPLPRATERQPPITATEAERRAFGKHDKLEANPDTAKASTKLQQTGYKGSMPKPFELAQRTPEHYPKKHAPGDLKIGDSVWYRGSERYWLIDVPPDWQKTSYVRVASEPHRPGTPFKQGIEVFWAHADLLERAPVRAGGLLVAQPTRHAVETREKMKKEGITDVGDDIGAMLRGKTLDEAYAICSKFIHVPEDELRAKYRKLNPGQQRMNLGNRMRGYAKKNPH